MAKKKKNSKNSIKKNKAVRAHVFVSGRVQGVFYRSWTKQRAKSMGLSGWVKNLDDGRVEAVFEGDKEDVEQMLEESENGSKYADVEDVEVEWEDPKGLMGFEVKY